MTARAPTPSADDLYLAAQWLDVFEDAEDRPVCLRVRDWLLQQSDAAGFREACRAAGVSVGQARNAAKRQLSDRLAGKLAGQPSTSAAGMINGVTTDYSLARAAADAALAAMKRHPADKTYPACGYEDARAYEALQTAWMAAEHHPEILAHHRRIEEAAAEEWAQQRAMHMHPATSAMLAGARQAALIGGSV